jgi:hypothetical protein
VHQRMLFKQYEEEGGQIGTAKGRIIHKIHPLKMLGEMPLKNAICFLDINFPLLI